MVDTTFETTYWNNGILHVAGVDEAGRGPLAGPVVAAAVIFAPGTFMNGVDDSKKLSHSARESLYEVIQRNVVGFGVGIVSHEIIDQINILQATYRAMHEAITNLKPHPQQLLIDGNRFKQNGIPFQTIIDGDAKSLSIAAASIIAKVTRDNIMKDYDQEYPEYGFAKHKGYATREHIEAIKKHGMCTIHRKSFHLKNEQLKLF